MRTVSINRLLKKSRSPLTAIGAKTILEKIANQMEAEKLYNDYHKKAQYIRLSIQNDLGLDCAGYYELINNA